MDFNFGRSFASPSGRTHFLENVPKTKNVDFPENGIVFMHLYIYIYGHVYFVPVIRLTTGSFYTHRVTTEPFIEFEPFLGPGTSPISLYGT